MLEKCLIINDNFQKALSFRDGYNWGDGGYNYLQRMNDFVYSLMEFNIRG